MLVAMSMLSLFIMLTLGMIVPGFRITKNAEESVAAQREVILAFDRLTAEVSMLDRASLSVAPGAMSFLSDKPYTGPNPVIDDTLLEDLGVVARDRTWTKQVILRQRDGELWRREYPYLKGGELWKILPDELEAIADTVPIAEKIYAKNVELFEVESAGRSRVRMKVRSVFRDNRKPVACEMTLQLQMRGGR